jgi:hypothetical protein
MLATGKLLRLSLAFVIFGMASHAQAQWSIVKKFVQRDIQIVQETEHLLVLSHNVVQDSLILSMAETTQVDIYAGLDQKRGGNPYRIWIATARFWDGSKRPKRTWGRFFHAEFLKIIRPPR